ncbi:MAG: hypothetical protein OXE52_13300 [Chloroflexi bacterium]|nr:hypothetical protein [Chloroflexota bacterium]
MNPDKQNPTLSQASPMLEDDDDREPTKEEILEDIRIGLRDVLAGYEGMPALEFLDELESETEVDANESCHSSYISQENKEVKTQISRNPR